MSKYRLNPGSGMTTTDQTRVVNYMEEHHKMFVAIIEAVTALMEYKLEHLKRDSAPPEKISQAIKLLESAMPPFDKMLEGRSWVREQIGSIRLPEES